MRNITRDFFEKGDRFRLVQCAAFDIYDGNPSEQFDLHGGLAVMIGVV